MMDRRTEFDFDANGAACGDPPPPRPGAGTCLVSWLLMLMALAALAPCILLPEWRAYQSAQYAVQEAQFYVDQLQQRIDREQRLINAIQTDPAVVMRLARRELPYQTSDDEMVSVEVPAMDGTSDVDFTPQPVDPPECLTRAAAHLPDLNYDAVFCDNSTRLPIIAMSIALLGVGLWLPRRP